MDIAEKVLQLKQDFDDVKAAGYTEGYEAGANAGGGGEGYDKGFEDGKQAEYDALWDSIQDNGNRTDYSFAFSAEMWTQDTFKPKYLIQPTTCPNICAYWGQYGQMTEPIDLRGLPIDFSKSTSLANAFYRNYQVSAVGVIDTRSAPNANAFFNDARGLETIEKFIVKDDGSTTLTNAFTNTRSLKNVEFEGVIGSNGLNFASSAYLTHESLMSLINHLKCFRYDARNHFVLNGSQQDIDGTYTIATAEQYENSNLGGMQCIAITFSDADFTIDFYNTGNEEVNNICKEGNKIEIKFSVATGLEECVVYDKDYATAHTVSLYATNLAKLTDAEKAIATEKGWTLT